MANLSWWSRPLIHLTSTSTKTVDKLKNEIVTIIGTMATISVKGVVVVAWQVSTTLMVLSQILRDYYYFSKDGKMVKDDFVTENGSTYYFDATGYQPNF